MNNIPLAFQIDNLKRLGKKSTKNNKLDLDHQCNFVKQRKMLKYKEQQQKAVNTHFPSLYSETHHVIYLSLCKGFSINKHAPNNFVNLQRNSHGIGWTFVLLLHHQALNSVLQCHPQESGCLLSRYLCIYKLSLQCLYLIGKASYL